MLKKFIVADDVTVEDVSDNYRLAHSSSLSTPPSDAPKDSLSFTCARLS